MVRKRNTLPVLLLLSTTTVLVFCLISMTDGQTPTPSLMNISAMYILGDSSVDCGENTLFYPLNHGNLSLQPCNGSDATLLPHILAQKMSLSSPLPFYSQNGSVNELRSGVNFGSAQATIIKTRNNSLQSLNQQIRQAIETLQLLQLQLGEEAAANFIKSAVFCLSFGKDDFVDLVLQNSTENMLNKRNQEFTNILVSQMIHSIRHLYEFGVRKIICFGIMPLGCTPRMVWHWSNTSVAHQDSIGCILEINDMVSEYNTMLNQGIAELNEEIIEGVIVFCDVYLGMMKIITNPDLYGFKDAKSACCGLGLNGAMIGCISVDMACEQTSSHVWWDFYNPTNAVNSLLAGAVWSGQPFSDICNPFVIRELVSN